ncbi:MAG TPA: isopentenyl-diphosphate Delta-isomerase [Candidatus Saccharimonadales bacterium]|nr:isopentenyl-diphosphate Delta-isomerase [Candidatus Saccharimonadales bacterium]
MAEEAIVFVDRQGRPTGKTGPKLESHTATTQLHLAFSCYVFNSKGQHLVTRRAYNKKVWPGVLTNSVCGHPAPGEDIEHAIRRRAAYELGLKIAGITCILPRYTYRTPPFQGIIENEFCPVYTAIAQNKLQPNPKEVAEYIWLDWRDYAAALQTNAHEYSYWAKDQYNYLSASKQFADWLTSIEATQ